VIGRLDGRGAGEVYETPSIADCRLQIADRRIADCRLPIAAIVDWALAIGHWRLGIGDWSLATRKPLEFLCQPAPLVLPTFGGFSRLDEDRRQFVCLLNQGLGVVHRHLVRRHEELKPPLRFVRFFGGQADLREELTWTPAPAGGSVVAVGGSRRIEQLIDDLSRRASVGKAFAEYDHGCREPLSSGLKFDCFGFMPQDDAFAGPPGFEPFSAERLQREVRCSQFPQTIANRAIADSAVGNSPGS